LLKHGDTESLRFLNFFLTLFAFFLISIVLDPFLPYLFDLCLIALILYAYFNRGFRESRFVGFEYWASGYLIAAVVSTVRGFLCGTVETYDEILPTFARTLGILLISPITSIYISKIDNWQRIKKLLIVLITVLLLIYTASILGLSLIEDSNGEYHRFSERLAGTISISVPIVLSTLPFAQAVIAGLALLIAIAVSGARAAFFGAIIGAASVFLILIFRKEISFSKLLFFCAVLLLIGFAFMPPQSVSGLMSLSGNLNTNAERGRILAWTVAVSEWFQSPILGRGVGAIRRVFYEGDWIRVLHQSGLIGLTFLAGAAGAVIVKLISIKERLAVGLLGTFIVLMLRSFFGSPFLRASDAGIFFVGMTFLLMNTNHESQITNPIASGSSLKE